MEPVADEFLGFHPILGKDEPLSDCDLLSYDRWKKPHQHEKQRSRDQDRFLAAAVDETVGQYKLPFSDRIQWVETEPLGDFGPPEAHFEKGKNLRLMERGDGTPHHRAQIADVALTLLPHGRSGDIGRGALIANQRFQDRRVLAASRKENLLSQRLDLLSLGVVQQRPIANRLQGKVPLLPPISSQIGRTRAVRTGAASTALAVSRKSPLQITDRKPAFQEKSQLASDFPIVSALKPRAKPCAAHIR
jgi:hypothetical protein